MDRSQAKLSMENRKCHMWPERTQPAECFLSRNLVSATFPERVLFKRMIKLDYRKLLKLK